MASFVKFILRIIFGIFYRVELINIENVPEKGGAVLCANHIGTIDMFFIGYKPKRLVHYMAKEELFKNPILGGVISSCGAYPVKRGKVDLEAIKTSLKLLKEGHIIGIFPEGTRRKEGKEIKVKSGAAMLATKAGVPVIPVGIKGSFKPFGHIKVIYGAPFMLDTVVDKKYTTEELEEMSATIMSKIYSLIEDK